MIVSLADDLRHAGNVRAAMLAGGRHHIAPGGGIWMQRPMRASVRLAVWLARRFIRRLAPLRGRRTRIIRRLRRQAELGFKFGDTRTKRGVLRLKTRHPDNNLVQPLDRLRLRQNKPDQCLTVQQLKRLLIHPWVDSHPPPRRQSVHAPPSQSAARGYIPADPQTAKKRRMSPTIRG